jgi:hypothetical protein
MGETTDCVLFGIKRREKAKGKKEISYYGISNDIRVLDFLDY